TQFDTATRKSEFRAGTAAEPQHDRYGYEQNTMVETSEPPMRSASGQWMVRPPLRCPRGHTLRPGRWAHMGPYREIAPTNMPYMATAALARGDLTAASRFTDDAVAATTGCWLAYALTMRALVAIAEGEPEQAERDAHDALPLGAGINAYLLIPDPLECLGTLAGEASSHREAARLFGAAHVIREPMGAVRFKVYDAGYEAAVAALRAAMGEQDFDA